MHDVGRSDALREVVDHFRFGEHGAHAGDRHRFLGGRDERTYLLRRVTHVAGGLLQERAGPGRALVVEPERLDLGALAEPARLHGLSADVQDGARAGEEERGATSGGREVGDLHVAHLGLVPPEAGGHRVGHVSARQAGIGDGAVTHAACHLRQLEPGGLHGAADDLVVGAQDKRLGVGRADVDPRCVDHASCLALAGARLARMWSSANSAAPSAPM